MSLYLVVTCEEKSLDIGLYFSCLAVLNKAILDTLIHVFGFLYVVEFLVIWQTHS